MTFHHWYGSCARSQRHIYCPPTLSWVMTSALVQAEQDFLVLLGVPSQGSLRFPGYVGSSKIEPVCDGFRRGGVLRRLKCCESKVSFMFKFNSAKPISSVGFCCSLQSRALICFYTFVIADVAAVNCWVETRQHADLFVLRADLTKRSLCETWSDFHMCRWTSCDQSSLTEADMWLLHTVKSHF